MEIKECGFYRMRNGEIAEVEYISKYSKDFAVRGGIPKDGICMHWSLTGYEDHFSPDDSKFDLVEYIGKTLTKRKVTKTIEGWVNVYANRDGTHYLASNIFDTESQCDYCSTAIDRIACVKVSGSYSVEE